MLCEPALRARFAQYLAVPRDLVATLPERLQHLLGYRTTHGIVGLVDAEDPLDAMKESLSSNSRLAAAVMRRR